MEDIDGNWAIIKTGRYTFRIRGNVTIGEPDIIVEPLDADCPPEFPSVLTTLANLDYEELRMRHMPHRCLAIAEVLAKNLDGEVLDFNRPSNEPLPPGIMPY